MDLSTPGVWLPILASRLDYLQGDVQKLRSYSNGDAPLPEMGKNTRATWLAFQRKARTNFGGIACQSHANRIRVRGVRVGSDEDSVQSQAARRIARDNRLPMVIGDAVWDMLSARRGYLLVTRDPQTGASVITAERPEQFYAEADPVRSWSARAAIKVWRDTVENIDYAYVWADGSEQGFWRSSFQTGFTGRRDDQMVRSANSGGWQPLGEPTASITGSQPVWIIDRRDGMALIEPHLDVIDRINLGKLQRLCIAAIQAFKQRALKKADGVVLPDKDESGNPIDWAKVFEPAPGALWDLPAGIDIWESQAQDLSGLLLGEKADARDFAAVTGTPVAMLQPDAQNQSATGAAATTSQQVDACQADIDRIKLAAAAAVATALQVEGVDLDGQTVEVDFENPAWATLAEQMDAYSKALAAGMSAAMAQKEFLGWSQEQVDEDARNKRRDAARSLMNSIAARPAQPTTPQVATDATNS